MNFSTQMFLAIADREAANITIYVFEIIALVISIVMIVIGLLQNKKAQTGLSALNGGNDELFANTKERGLDRTLSIFMLSFGISLFVVTLIIALLTHILLK
ncbi:preprotein translocase subunit SecG [Spiroplasma syrphidicola EA-1]|uniref:Protein-export membrane protein SecG n=1 Tax=Spiroplasma syrphidicola EA-1 TaxID=1276229 RepID=R4U2V8_9MOLU|nr:preprotein translocase subunit SecG [Spiroplasma syrphidicola]AGM25712.1 preprotein translocase subunit SecG [Spiroplasma syrphidicola EA-1]